MFDSKISSNLINVKQEEEKCLKRESSNDEKAIKVIYWSTIIKDILQMSKTWIWPVNAVAGHFRQNFQRFQAGIQSHRQVRLW